MSKKSELPRRTVVLSEALWQALDADAERCYRSVNGQIEAVLSAIYLNADTTLHGLERGAEKTGLVQVKNKKAASG